MPAYYCCIMSFPDGCYWLNVGSMLYNVFSARNLILVFPPLSPIPYISLSQDLKDFMRKAGEVSYADVRRDRDSEG